MGVHASEHREARPARHPADGLARLARGAWSRVRSYSFEGKLAAFVIFAGQSNALGFGMDGSTLPGEYGKPDPLTLIWSSRAQAFEVMQPGVNTGTANTPAAWAAEVAFARAFRQANPKEPLYIVKSAKGSTGLAADPQRIDWSPSSTGEMFDATAAEVAAARAAAGVGAVDAVFIVQGEQDATQAAWADAYGRNVTDWFAAIRTRWMADPEGPIFFARVGEPLAHAQAVSRAQALADAADPHAASVETTHFLLQADSLHYSAAAHLEMGQAFGRLFVAERSRRGARAAGSGWPGAGAPAAGSRAPNLRTRVAGTAPLKVAESLRFPGFSPHPQGSWAPAAATAWQAGGMRVCTRAEGPGGARKSACAPSLKVGGGDRKDREARGRPTRPRGHEV
ncbi:sialate O-acetylesterase [Phenylobacterium sp.]|uniref:sialate O-acetylesterase n=1 Tax=Phenylobacterium sp. TaxID=1871053 RepID=UPI002F93BD30